MIDATGRPQSVLVLGGASEIAQAIVAALVPGRCRTVILAGRPSDRLDAAADAARAAGADVVETVAFDTTDLSGNPAVVEDVFARFGDVDLVLAAARCMRVQGYGRIVVISSVAGERARKANFIYGSTKSGLDAFAQGLGDSLVGSGVGVTVVRPGFVVGRMTEGMDPAPFSTTPEAVAEAVVKGISSGADLVYAPPILRWVFLVMKQLPRAVWRRMPG